MKDALPASVARGRHDHTLGRSIPVASGNHAAPKGAKPDEHHAVAASLLADELAEVHHAVPGHIGEPRVADMCVVRPHDRLRVRAMMVQQVIQGLGHVAIADVPRLGAAAHHGTVVGLGILQHERVLLGLKISLAPFRSIGGRLAADLPKQRDHFVLAGRGHEARGTSVRLDVLAEGLEAAQRTVCCRQRGGVDPVQVGHHEVEGLPQAIDVEAIEADPPRLWPLVIPRAQPLDQLDDLLVGPHPRWPTVEGVEHLAGVIPRALEGLDIAVDPITVRPVPLDGDEGEALLLDEPLTERRTPAVILRGSMRRLAEKHASRRADLLQQRIEMDRGGERARELLHLLPEESGRRRLRAAAAITRSHGASSCHRAKGTRSGQWPDLSSRVPPCSRVGAQ